MTADALEAAKGETQAGPSSAGSHDAGAQVVATASGDATLRLWSLADGAALRTFQGHGASVLRVSFVASGAQVWFR